MLTIIVLSNFFGGFLTSERGMKEQTQAEGQIVGKIRLS
jgi:hypothetical protein